MDPDRSHNAIITKRPTNKTYRRKYSGDEAHCSSPGQKKYQGQSSKDRSCALYAQNSNKLLLIAVEDKQTQGEGVIHLQTTSAHHTRPAKKYQPIQIGPIQAKKSKTRHAATTTQRDTNGYSDTLTTSSKAPSVVHGCVSCLTRLGLQATILRIRRVSSPSKHEALAPSLIILL